MKNLPDVEADADTITDWENSQLGDEEQPGWKKRLTQGFTEAAKATPTYRFIQVKLPLAMANRASRAAKAAGLSREEWIRRIIKKGVEEHEASLG